MQQAHAATVEEMEQAMEEEEYQGYEQEDVHDLAAQTSRLSEDQQGNLLEEMIKADLDF